MTVLEQNLRDATKLLKRPDGSQPELSDILNFQRDSLFLMPSAFQPLRRVLYSHTGEIQVPNPEFGDHCFRMRKKLIDLALSGRCNVGSIQQWGTRFCTVKQTIDRFKDLANFSGVLALQTRQAFDEQIKVLLDKQVYGTDPACAEDSMSAKLHKIQEDMKLKVEDCLKKSYPDGATGRARELKLIREKFDSCCAEEASRASGESGYLTLPFKAFCATNTAISDDMLREGIKTLRDRVIMFINGKKATFETLHQRNEAENTYTGIFEELRSELGELRKGRKNISNEEAERLFDRTWAEKKNKLKAMLESNRPDYSHVVSQSVACFVSSMRTDALDSYGIRAEDPDKQLRAVQFSRVISDENPMISNATGCTEFVDQFHHCFTFAQQTTPGRRRKGVLEGIWEYSSSKTAEKQFFLISTDEGGKTHWHGMIRGDEYSGLLEQDDRGKVFSSISNGSKRRKLFEVDSRCHAFESGSIQFRLDKRPWQPAKKKELQEESLANICSFFRVQLPDVQLPDTENSSFHLLKPHTWPSLFSRGSTDCLDEVEGGAEAERHAGKADLLDAMQDETKREVLQAAYRFLSQVMSLLVEECDDELTNLVNILKSLFESMESPGSVNKGCEQYVAWAFTAPLKNECLRSFCKWVEYSAQEKRMAKDTATITNFETDMAPLRKGFISAVTQAQSDMNNAALFVDELLMTVQQKLKSGVQSRAVSNVTGHFGNPEECLKVCDTIYISKFDSPEGRTAAEVYQYVVDPATEMRKHLAAICDDRLATEQGAANSRWVALVSNLKSRLADLCEEVLAQHMSFVQEHTQDEALTSPETNECQKTFVCLMDLINKGVGRMWYGTLEKEITTAVQVLGEDQGKYELVINNVDSIMRLETFLTAMLKCLQQGGSIEPITIDMATEKATILSDWVGCQEKCPYCRKKCSLSKHEAAVKHKCAFHQPIGFGGVKVKATNKPLFITCDNSENQSRTYAVRDKEEVLEFTAHCKKCHPDWDISLSAAGTAAYNMMEAGYMRVWNDADFRKRLCDYHGLQPIPWEEGVGLATKTALSKIQVALVLDTTGSMGPEIHQCKTDCVSLVTDIARKVASELGNTVTVQFAFCGYKDCGDDGHLQSIDFKGGDGYGAVKALIEKQRASGGGDCPEDMLNAFRTVQSFSWAEPSDAQAKRIMILIADAPCHGPEYTEHHDDHPGDGKSMPAVLTGLTSQKINCCFSVINPRVTARMEQAFKAHWDKHGDKGCVFRTFQSRRETGDRILDNVLDSIQTLIQSSMA